MKVFVISRKIGICLSSATFQIEKPDSWLTYGNPWEKARPEYTIPVKFYGHTRKTGNRVEWVSLSVRLSVRLFVLGVLDFCPNFCPNFARGTLLQLRYGSWKGILMAKRRKFANQHMLEFVL